jgi:membrane-associated protease RseP (regulator of RpoE activity)
VEFAGGPLARKKGTVLELAGKLRVPSENAYSVIFDSFKVRGYIALLRRTVDQDQIVAVPGDLPSAPAWNWLGVAMFLATVITVLFAGSNQQTSLLEFLLALPSALLGGAEKSFVESIFQSMLSGGLWSGWPFAVSLLGILVTHELGHFLVSRLLNVPATLPYFIPLPLPPFGTMGAVIRMVSPPHNRRKLLAIAAAGPLAGLMVAVPVLVYGLSLSTVEVIPPGASYAQEGNSILYATIKFLMFGRLLPSGGQDVFLHPIAWAGWAGLLVTALNLIPAGQLDGGHIAYALLGERAKWLVWGVVAALAWLSSLWLGWLIWLGLVLVFGRVHAVPLDDVTRLRMPEQVLVVFMLVVFALVFMPIPLMIT